MSPGSCTHTRMQTKCKREFSSSQITIDATGRVIDGERRIYEVRAEMMAAVGGRNVLKEALNISDDGQ